MEMKTDFKDRFTSLESQVSQIPRLEEKISTKITSHIDTKFKELNTDLGNIRLQLEEQEKRLYILEKNSVQRNLMFFGVEETEKTYFQLENKIMDILNNNMKISTLELELQAVRRVGRKGERPRPISVTFSTLGKKIKILQNKRQLEGTNLYIKEEYPAKILKAREELKQKQKEEFDKGNIAIIRYDKLVIKDKKNETNTNKRQHSTSPPQTMQPRTNTQIIARQNKEQQIVRSNKKYKALNSMMSYVKRNEEA